MVLMIFFVNIGPDLANKIVIPENNDVLQYMNDRNVSSMFYMVSIKKKCWMLLNHLLIKLQQTIME